MTPKPWSYSTLSDFVNCPRSFHQKNVLKRFPYVQGEEAAWGEKVHKIFENYVLATNKELPLELREHKPYLDGLLELPGVLWAEQSIGLSKQVKPCHFFATDVWMRGKIDVKSVSGDYAKLVDYKTGKVKNDKRQLTLFAIHTFALHEDVQRVDAEYYWTKTLGVTTASFERKDLPAMWSLFVPDLKQWKEAFETDTWQPRQSGLCAGWCPVTDCEFWKPRRVK